MTELEISRLIYKTASSMPKEACDELRDVARDLMLFDPEAELGAEDVGLFCGACSEKMRAGGLKVRANDVIEAMKIC